tara:strand:- start:179 stop:331 length:153 start_codon:yes stop_codon:yes gene_type:complete
MVTTKVKVVVEYECDYDGHITEDDIDLVDVLIIPNLKAVKNVKLKHLTNK